MKITNIKIYNNFKQFAKRVNKIAVTRKSHNEIMEAFVAEMEMKANLSYYYNDKHLNLVDVN